MTLVVEGLFLRQFTAKGTKKVQWRIHTFRYKGGMGGGGGGLGLIRGSLWAPPLDPPLGFLYLGFGIVRDSLSTAFKGLTVNIFACVSSYCLSCGNNEVNFLNLVFPITNTLAI